jgi:uncharacterized cupin superfamily protein
MLQRLIVPFTMKSPIINIAEYRTETDANSYGANRRAAAERFGARMGFISNLIGGKQLGYNITAIPKGKRAFPFHNHQVNEQMFFVLAGHGEIRIGDGAFPIKEGDIIACPAGGKETAHQIINTSEEELRFLAVSTRLSPEIAEYPDTNRFGVLASLAPDETGRPRTMMYVGKEGDSLYYREGE